MLSYCKNLKKGRPLAFILAIVLVVAMALSVSAFAPMQSWADPAAPQLAAPVNAAPNDIVVTVFDQTSGGAVYYNESTSYTTVEGIYFDVTEKSDYSTDIIYTINGEFRGENPETQPVENGDLLEFFLVDNYTEQSYATIDPRTDIIVKGTLYTSASSTPTAISGGQVGFDFDEPYTDILTGAAVTPTVGGIIVSGGGVDVLNGYLPVVTNYASWNSLSTYLTTMSAMLVHEGYAAVESGELSSADATDITGYVHDLETALIKASSTGDYSGVVTTYLTLGRYIYVVDHVKNARPNRVSFDNNVAAIVPFNKDLSYSATTSSAVPDAGYTYTIAPTDGSEIFYGTKLTVSVWANPGQGYTVTADNGASVASNSVVTFSTAGGFTNITVNMQGSTPLPRATRHYRFTIRQETPTKGNPPSDVNGYLPAPGQYSSGTGWGSISTDDENSLNSKYLKLVNGEESVGVSLGSYGGYVQVEYDEPITDSAMHPYGVDFIVYGNAFAGFSEAGAVQVATATTTTSVDGDIINVPDTWYELAGSRYYDMPMDMGLKSGSFPNATVDYVNNTANKEIDYDFSDYFYNTPSGSVSGIYTSGNSWWPDYDAKPTGENYSNSSGLLLPDSKIPTQGPVSVKFTSDNTYLTFGGITKVFSSLAYDDYKYGYADVHGSGAADGDAVNPYNTAGGGGDGFDLAWAVGIESGEPVSMAGKEIYFIRVYTAPMNPQSGYNEISTEVTGISTANESHDPIGMTSQPAIYQGSSLIPLAGYDSGDLVEIPYSSLETVALSMAGADNMLLNNDSIRTQVDLSDGEDHYVRAVAQSGQKAPYILTLLFYYEE
ncbi:MAG: hypothetical protein LBJ91_06820 [Clostridiales Family XIII bacterium]|jgi:hypothetical protein|nr:hypothetical protein [Clostridiales Family XIII bacterium]